MHDMTTQKFKQTNHLLYHPKSDQ